ncbi:MAG: 5'/3'-nucleotidase SurE [Planctomycetes bacterium]|nr:5'/3'-nucleotidase SurE [Planctomycetota bacterium]MCW8135087.1 5'/3'-nucleotidase SurE [Planctomycetota bacterium]
MRILVTNDDGIDAQGIAMLTQAAQRVGGEVFVVAPERQHSAQAHAITIHSPVFARELPHTHGEARRVAVEGTPCDCVRLACIKLMGGLPDLCLSGINHGGNLGWNIFFSGTVGAAAEAHSFGVPSIAVSYCKWGGAIEWGALDQLVAGLVRRLLKAKHSRPDWLYNINLPPLEPEQIKGVRLTRQNPVVKGDNFEERVSPDGRRYFWPVWDEVKAEREKHTDPELDTVAVRDGYISITPLRYDVSNMNEPGVVEAFKGFKPD